MDDLTLQVGHVDDIEINNPDAADARGREVEAQRRAQTASAYHQYTGLFEFDLALHADFRHDQVTAITKDLVVTKDGSGCCHASRNVK